MRRLTVRRLTWLLVAAGLLCQPRSTRADISEQRVREAVNRAAGYLKKQLPQLHDAHLGIAVLGLLKSGVPADDPAVKSAIEKLAGRIDATGNFAVGSHHNYDAGVTLMALANADAQKYQRQIAAIANYLIAHQCPDGGWDYPGRTTGDTSITQYAILGLWEAARSGVSVPVRVWDKAASWHMRRQIADGGFAYHPADGDVTSIHTMTAAGTASLHVARLHLFPDARDIPEPDDPANRKARNRRKFGVLVPAVPDADEAADLPESKIAPAANYTRTVRLAAIDAAIARGNKWMSDRFSITPQTPWQLYYLYGVERLTALAGLSEIAGHDWYAEGAQHLLAGQFAHGSWNDQSGEAPATSLGIMFLVKATAKMVHGRRPDPRFGGGLLIGGRGLPDDLQSVQLEQGAVKTRKPKGPVEELLAQLENPSSRTVESSQQALVETIATENPEALIGQRVRLLKLVGDRRIEVRRTAYWALGRTNDLRVVPILIQGLSDSDPSCVIEARNALRYVSKRLSDSEPPDQPTDEQRSAAIAHWRRWYFSVRPYDERDDLQELDRSN